MLGNFLSCIRGAKDTFKVQGGRWDFSQDATLKRASSRIEGRISWFFSSCGRKLGVPLQSRWGPQGPTRVASEKSILHAYCEGPLWIRLQSVPWLRSSYRVEASPSGLLSSTDLDLSVPTEFQLESQASSPVETCKSAFLSRCHCGIGLISR